MLFKFKLFIQKNTIMKGHFRLNLLLLVAILATALFSCFDAQACNSVMHYASNISTDHIGMAMAAVALVPLSKYVKDNCTITPDEIAALSVKYDKIKILTVVLESPTYDDEGNLTDKGEFYSYACRRPDQGTIRLMMGYVKKGDTDSYIECFIKNIIIAGNTDILKTDGLVYLGLSSEVDNFLKPYQSFLEKA